MVRWYSSSQSTGLICGEAGGGQQHPLPHPHSNPTKCYVVESTARLHTPDNAPSWLFEASAGSFSPGATVGCPWSRCSVLVAVICTGLSRFRPPRGCLYAGKPPQPLFSHSNDISRFNSSWNLSIACSPSTIFLNLTHTHWFKGFRLNGTSPMVVSCRSLSSLRGLRLFGPGHIKLMLLFLDSSSALLWLPF